MELAFADRELRSLCLNEFKAKQELGPEPAEKLKRRLADLSAAPMVSDIFNLPGNPRKLPGHQAQVVVDLIDEWQLFFQSGHVKKHVLATGEVDWARIRRIKILRVGKQR